MAAELKKMIEDPYELPETPNIGDGIHAYMFVYDSSNKRTFTSMSCMVETIFEMEKTKKKGGGKIGKKKGNN
jgi:hypothetical protein